MVYEVNALFEEGGAQDAKAALLWMPLSQWTDEVLVSSALPRRIRVCKVDLASDGPRDLGVASKFEAVIENDCTYQRSVGFKEGNDGGRYFTSIFARDFRSETEAAFALYKGHNGAFVVAANDGIPLPVPDNRPFLDACASVLNPHPIGNTAPSTATRAIPFASLLLASQVTPERLARFLAGVDSAVEVLMAHLAKAQFFGSPRCLLRGVTFLNQPPAGSPDLRRDGFSSPL